MEQHRWSVFNRCRMEEAELRGVIKGQSLGRSGRSFSLTDGLLRRSEAEAAGSCVER